MELRVVAIVHKKLFEIVRASVVETPKTSIYRSRKDLGLKAYKIQIK